MALRSYLFVPGNRPSRFNKAFESGAGVVIIDLEDAVPPDEKRSTRETVAAILSPARPVYIRINGTDTEWFQDDLAAVQHPGVVGIVLPKAEGKDQVAMVAGRLLPHVHIVPIVESALGIWNALEIASAPQVERLVFGSLDFQLDTNITGDYEELLYARSRLVLASRIAGILPPLDSVTTVLDNDDLLAADVQKARRLGFGGKMCIHPQQVRTVNNGFLPTEQEIVWAKTVMEAIESMGEGALRLNGAMVDRPIIEKARKILAAAHEP